MDKYLKKLLKYMSKLTLALLILVRIKKCYPHIFEECSNQEEVDKLLEKKDK